MQDKTSWPPNCAPDNPWKGRFQQAVQKAAQHLQEVTNKWSAKTLAASLWLFVTLSASASLYILFASFSREAVSGVSVTSIRFANPMNRPGVGANLTGNAQKTAIPIPKADKTSGPNALPPVTPQRSAHQPQ